MKSIATLILAAGKGVRMKSNLAKVLHPILGRPMLSYPIELSLNGIKAEKTIVVVGHQAERIQKIFKNDRITFVLQKEQLGTGHAVLQAMPFLQSFNGMVLILCGDVPLLREETLRFFIEAYRKNKSVLSVMTAIVENPSGYGRILRTPAGWLKKIVEDKDASAKEKKIPEINTGIYCIKASFLRDSLGKIGKENAQREYYLTDLVEIAVKKKLKCSAYVVADSRETMGINTRADLAVAHEVLRDLKERSKGLNGEYPAIPALQGGVPALPARQEGAHYKRNTPCRKAPPFRVESFKHRSKKKRKVK